MELDEIRAFVAVAQTGSLSRAAGTLHLSQPAVTRQIQRLEAALGVKLLDRRTKPVTLTAAGQAVLEQCRQIVRSVEDLPAAVSDGGGPAGEVRLGISTVLADMALARPIDAVRQAFPRVTLQISTAWSRKLLERCRDGHLDAALVFLPEGSQPPAGLTGELMWIEPLSFVAARRARLPKQLTLRDLGGMSWILNTDGCGFRATLGRALQALNLPLRVAVEVNGEDLQISLVARGLGLGLVPTRVLARSRLRSRLRTVRVRGQAFRLEVWLVYGRPPGPFEPVFTLLRQEVAAAHRRGG